MDKYYPLADDFVKDLRTIELLHVLDLKQVGNGKVLILISKIAARSTRKTILIAVIG